MLDQLYLFVLPINSEKLYTCTCTYQQLLHEHYTMSYGKELSEMNVGDYLHLYEKVIVVRIR